MKWGDLLRRVGGGSLVRLGGYEHLDTFACRDDFFTGTRVYPAEPTTVYSFLIRVCADQDAEAVTRLTWHARVIHELQSPHIPPLADLGIDERRWYLASRIEPPLGLLRVPDGNGPVIIRQVAQALAYLHDQGFAHRGLSPSAIAVDGRGAAQLFDLWWIGRFQADRLVRSVLGRRQRSPYDAPEAGAEEFDGVRADIYSLGVLARKLLPADHQADLVREMTRESPEDRPPSMSVVVRALDGP